MCNQQFKTHSFASLFTLGAFFACVDGYAATPIALSPISKSLAAGQTQQFTVKNAVGNGSYVYTLNPAVGTISATGLYSAPSALTSGRTVNVTVRSATDSSVYASASVFLNPALVSGVSITPTTVALGSSQTQAFVATVSGNNNKTVTWSLSVGLGTISSTGVYTAPATIANAQTVIVKATSVADPSKSGVSTVSLKVPVSVSLSSSGGSLMPLQSQRVTAVVAGSANSGVNWTINPAIGSLSTSPTTAVYVAPSAIDQAQTVTITASAMADPTKIASVAFALMQAVSVSISPSAVSLAPGGSQQFTAQVTGARRTEVNWSIDPAVGTIDETGLYTAPSVIAAAQTVTIKSQSIADPAKTGASSVSLQPASLIRWSIDANRLSSLSYGGQNFYQYMDSIVQGARFRAPDGTITDAGWNKPNKVSLLNNPPAFEQIYNLGRANQFTLRVTWTQTDSRTLKAVAKFTNNDPNSTLVSLGLHLLPVNLPGPATQYNQNVPIEVNQFNGQPAQFLSGNWGSIAHWQSGYPTNGNQLSYYRSASQTSFDPILTTSTAYGPRTYSLETPPGETNTMTQFVRFGASTDTASSLAPEAFEEYRSAFPNQVNWPDRRPIAYWMIAEGTKRSASNPRGYLWDPALDVTKGNFQTRVLAAADNTIGILNSMSVRPQGMIIWDLEGQEFNHAFTYVGNPMKLGDLAPEMDAVVDSFFAKFTAAGFRTGVTIRPNHFGTGTALPESCKTDSNYALWDKFILLNAPFPYRSYVCSATNSWQASSANGPGAQTTTQDYNDALDLLQQRIRYARNRWGTTLFYIDSSVWEGGKPIDPSIFRTLASMFPDCLIIPENTVAAHFGSTAPYNWLSGYRNRAADARTLYPEAFQVMSIANVTIADQPQLVNMVKAGDILLFPAWFSSQPEVRAVQDIYKAAGIK